jgi:hypothetical protein
VFFGNVTHAGLVRFNHARTLISEHVSEQGLGLFLRLHTFIDVSAHGLDSILFSHIPVAITN